MSEVLWRPPADALETTRVGQWMRWLEGRGVQVSSYDEAWQWSVDSPDDFWRSVADWFELPGLAGQAPALAHSAMPGARWFPDARLNYARAALDRAPAEALVCRSQTRGPSEVSGDALRGQVARAAAGLRALGVGEGDRVVALLPTIPEAVVAFLATASLGAVWASCPPEFGVRAVVERFSQLDPAVLIAVDGYRHRGKEIDLTGDVAEIRGQLPTVQHLVTVPYLSGEGGSWSSLLDHEPLPDLAEVAFDHPLYVLFSSGTTGLPKPIVHTHGGILLEHSKILALHHDMGEGDRFFWFTTTGWMMWNYLVSGLLVGATLVLFDGDPGHPSLDTLWALAEETGVTHLGASAPFLMACRKEGLKPGADHDLSRVREVGSTGAPLPAEGFHWVHDAVGAHVRLSSVSGGTDVCTAFVGGSPLLPVVAGEITCRVLGAAVDSVDDDGHPVRGVPGNLVLTRPLPSMPAGFLGDPDGSRYRDAYFARFPGLWDHGDWITITDTGSCIITGRSDATLNRAGVRLGTSDFYAVVEELEEVSDSLVVHLEADDGAGELILFVVTPELTPELETRIKRALRESLSPRHVPDRVVQVPAVPRTRSGKKLEVPVKRVLQGVPVSTALSRESLVDASAMDAFVALAAQS